MEDKNIKVLFRKSIDTEEEFKVCSSIFDTKEQRTDLSNSLVIGRYSVLPYYLELEKDLANKGCRLINSYRQHRWVANFDYYEELKDYTFETWFDMKDIPDVPMVIKGRTNSRKAKWNIQMFAKNRKQAIEIALELIQDPLLQEQGIIFRRYIPLETLEIGLNEQPFTNEFRFFMYKEDILSYGYYWTQCEHLGEMDTNGLLLITKLSKIVSKYIDFYVLDIAKTQGGKWVLVEINDAQMSGLSLNRSDILYNNLKNILLNEI